MEKKVFFFFLILKINFNFNFIDPFVMAALGTFYKFKQHIRKSSTQEMSSVLIFCIGKL